MSSQRDQRPIIVAGGGIGGLAAALALTREGRRVTVLEQAPEVGEIGAGVQFGPNAFTAYDALGVGPQIRARAVYTDSIWMMDGIDGHEVARIDTGEAFQERFGNPYAVAHRAEVHQSLLDGVLAANGAIEIITSTRVETVEQDDNGVRAIDENGKVFEGAALIGCDGVRSVVRRQLIGDPVRVSGHVVYRAVIDKEDFPEDLQWNGPAVWVGPNCHIVHYPVMGGSKFNIVVTFHSREVEEWSVRDGSREEVLSYFTEMCEKPHKLLSLPKTWRRWATADREPVSQWSFGRMTLLGDAAHPMMQYMAQGACMAIEDAVTLGKALASSPDDFVAAFKIYEKARIVRTARVLLSTREFGRLIHMSGVERDVRNSLWKGHTQDRFYDALEWLYGWRAENCLDH